MWQEIIVWTLFAGIIAWKSYKYVKPKKNNAMGCGCSKCDAPKSQSIS